MKVEKKQRELEDKRQALCNNFERSGIMNDPATTKLKRKIQDACSQQHEGISVPTPFGPRHHQGWGRAVISLASLQYNRRPYMAAMHTATVLMQPQTPIGFSVYIQQTASVLRVCAMFPNAPHVGKQKKGGRVDNNGKKAKKYFPHIAGKQNMNDDWTQLFHSVMLCLSFCSLLPPSLPEPASQPCKS